ncbi:hypothetical protein BDY19DRAFT_904326 [Irpex rosettiformis]|uniref:Uncharacterized protein n=1 Tax=Irpex rosettiformis TaxID=378272 RepID=A0ACB8UBU5_9APHY|nr:hypothetical protein BDY19DRAFT_904326 [Irpex rosettiformis]
MSNNLYEILGLERNATAEDIRKAYRKRALTTHPDRLPQGVSEAERERANEEFRLVFAIFVLSLVNNAYEVLNDPNNRKLYDQCGVWPPTVETQPQAGPSYNSQNRTFSAFGSHNPFETNPFFSSRPSPFGTPFHFTDPFELFNSLFGDTHRPGFDWGDDFNDPFFGGGHPFMSPPFSAGPLGMAFGPRDPWGRPLMGQFGPFAGHPMLSAFGAGNPNVHSYSSTSQAIGSGGNWVSQSTVTRSINGRTETITKRRDAQGNEHVTYSSPEGERYTINGVEQPTNRPLVGAPAGPSQPLLQPPPPPSQVQHAAPPVIPLSRPQSQRSANYPYDQNDATRRGTGSSYRKIYEDGVRSSHTHDGRRPSRDEYYDPSHTRSYHSYDSSSSQRRNKIYAGETDDGHHVGDSGSRHHDDKHGVKKPGW